MMVSVVAKTMLKGHSNVKLNRNPLIPNNAPTNKPRSKEVNKFHQAYGSTIVLSDEISMPPGCRPKFERSVYSRQRKKRQFQCQTKKQKPIWILL